MNVYIEKIIKHYQAKEENVYCIYYKFGDESYKNISLIQEGKNIRTFLREEIIEIFDKYEGSNIIFQDYLLNLKAIQNEKESFKSKDLRKDTFTWNEVIGFYNELDKAFVRLKSEGIIPKDIDFNWYYTANQKGGFMCYYFQNVLYFDECGYYLQLDSNSIPEKSIQENLKFVFKVWSYNKKFLIIWINNK